MKFTIKLADKTIQVEGHSPELRDFFADYLFETSSPELHISLTKQEILSEQDSLEADFPSSYLETLAALRKIAEVFPLHERLLIHGASIAYDEKGYLFTAPSGTGKSTHIKLWRKYLGPDIKIINGDKPFLSLEDAQPRIYGSPWAGKENWHKNHSFPLAAICIVQRGLQNKIRRLEPAECLTILFNQIYMPSDPIAAGATLELADKLLQSVPVYLLECDISEDAVRCSFEALTNSKYEKK